MRTCVLVVSLSLAFATGARAILPCDDTTVCPDDPPCGVGACLNGICGIVGGNVGTVCRGSTGPCDPAERCNGGKTCPGDARSPNGTVCRPAVGNCDRPEVCDGVNAGCPADALFAAGTVCNPAQGVCDVAEACDGVHPTCPVNAFEPATKLCRASAGPCDVAEFCSGTSAACPADQFLGASTVCRASAGACDAAETCDGAHAACPNDALVPAGTICRPAANDCDLADACNGSSKDCPGDATVPSGTACENASACVSGGSCVGPVCLGGQPELTFVPDTVDFAQGVRDLNVLIKHTGTGPAITLTNAGIDPAGTFTIVTAPQWPVSLAAGAQAELAVRLAADAAPGEHVATLKIQAAGCADQPVPLHALVPAPAPDAGSVGGGSDGGAGGGSPGTGGGGCSSSGVPAAALALVALATLASRRRRARP